MLNIYKTDDTGIHELDAFEDGAWVKLTAPTKEEGERVSKAYGIEYNDLRAALDEEESSRVSLEDGYTLILVDIPTLEIRHEKRVYTTIPLSILLTQKVIITVCNENTPMLNYFLNQRLKEFSTKKKMRFVYQMLYRSTALYQSYLKVIDRKRTEIEEKVLENYTENADLISLHELESSLVYFATSLRANGIVLERLQRYKRLPQYPEDMDLLEDVIIENKQAIEMTAIYRDIIDGTRDLVSSIMDNRLNNVMKILTSITLVMAVPTVISGLYGMNVAQEWMPLAFTPHGFGLICLITTLICLITMWILKRKDML